MIFENLRLLIIEDDEVHLKILDFKLRQLGIVHIDSVSTYKEALTISVKSNYDLIFCDFYLDKGKTCLDLLPKIVHIDLFPIIFITGYYDDFVLSQIPKGRHIALLSKNSTTFDLKKQIIMLLSTIESTSNNTLDDGFLFVRKNKKIIKITLDELMYVEVEGKYLNLSCKEEVHMIRASLSEFHKRLHKQFVKIHQSIVVNIHFIHHIDIEKSTVDIYGIKLPISRAYKKVLLSNRYFS